MRHAVFIVLLSFMSVDALASDLRTQFVGKWRSDEPKTLESMRLHPEITDRVRKLFENKFFGRLVLVVTEKQSASYWAEEEGKAKLEFEPYEISEVGKDYLVVKYTNPMLDTKEKKRWYFENGYMYTYTSKWKFREYFRKIQ